MTNSPETTHIAGHEVPRIGMGCWAIGGPFSMNGSPAGWGETDDAESKATIEASWDAGVRVFDTAQAYGTGHSETLLGDVLGNRKEAFIVSKFGHELDSQNRILLTAKLDADHITSSIEASRKRLQRDTIDLMLLHINVLDNAKANRVFDTLEGLVERGLIAKYGWSTDFPDSVDAMAGRQNFVAIQHAMNVFLDVPSINESAATGDLIQMIRSPLAMGLLTGKFSAGQRIGGKDVRTQDANWQGYFDKGVPSEKFMAQLEAVRELLMSDGRTITQGALCWLLAKGPNIVPVPGARTPEQASENAGALEFGPLPNSVMTEIETILDRPPEGEPGPK
ncbi:aldo/keto reductase [Ahrensia sp. R2A130]|uniref:aldo/keto reductase n=1 Tax=Ahrensia sp. R2A130 TaxID=744979 RepID=UPI0001E0B49C|nr:aldo/keto reductase [Ahrensia sp. R2A130]EFL89721.1 aldo/keto reductase [Ahrensia sp. R2A130]